MLLRSLIIFMYIPTSYAKYNSKYWNAAILLYTRALVFQKYFKLNSKYEIRIWQKFLNKATNDKK